MACVAPHAMATRSKKRPAAVTVDFSKTASQTTLLLTKLPAELRNVIFELISSTTTMRYMRRARVGTPQENDGKPSPPAYLLTCKEIYLDSINMFYANAYFHFSTLAGWHSWTAKLNKQKVSLAKKTEIAGKLTREAHFAKYGYGPEKEFDDNITVVSKAKALAEK